MGWERVGLEGFAPKVPRVPIVSELFHKSMCCNLPILVKPH